MTTLTSLRERVEKATGPDREIDVEIFFELDWTGQGDARTAPEYTSSIDAVVALIERELPGWAWKEGTCCVSDDAWLAPDFNSPDHGDRLRQELSYAKIEAGDILDVGIDIDRRPSGNPALALLLAFLKAKLVERNAT